MLKILVYKEIKNTVFTFQFQFITILSIVICIAYIFIGLSDYETRLQNYDIMNLKNNEEISNLNVYSELQPQISLRPKVLSIISNGSINELGSNVRISPFEVPTKLNNEITYNPFINSVFQFDFNKVVAILLSLLAILISFNLISEEHEKGTLKLMMSNYVPKWKIIIAKVISSQIVITITLSFIFIIIFLGFLFSSSVSISLEHIIRILLIFILYQFYLSCFILIGTFFSIVTRKSSISLILGLFVWLLFTIIIPYGVMFITLSDSKFMLIDEVNKQIAEVEKNTTIELNTWKQNHSVPGPAYTFGYVQFNERENHFITRGIRPEYIQWCADYFAYRNRIVIDQAEKIYNLKKIRLDHEENQIRYMHSFANLSITNQLCKAVENLCNTSWDDYKTFMDDAREYRLSIISYIRSDNGFSSREWFTDDPVGFEPWVKDPNNFRPEKLANDAKIGYKVYLAINVHKNLAERKLKLDDVPLFLETSVSVGLSLKESLVEFATLLILSGIFLFLILVFFNKYYIVS